MITMRFEKPINEMASSQAPETTGPVALNRLTNRNNDRKIQEDDQPALFRIET